MPGQDLTGLDRRAGRHEIGDADPSQAMKVGHPRVGFIGDAGGGRVRG